MSLGYLVYSHLSHQAAPHVPFLCNPSEDTPVPATRKAQGQSAQVSTTRYHLTTASYLGGSNVTLRGLDLKGCPMASFLSPLHQFLDQNCPHISPQQRPVCSFAFPWQVIVLETLLNTNFVICIPHA